MEINKIYSNYKFTDVNEGALSSIGEVSVSSETLNVFLTATLEGETLGTYNYSKEINGKVTITTCLEPNVDAKLFADYVDPLFEEILTSID